MDILTILATLHRHKITTLLIMLEIAITCAIVCNVVFLIEQRLQRMDMPSGVAEHELVQMEAQPFRASSDARARSQEDLAALRQIPGVRSVALVNEAPFDNHGWSASVDLSRTQTQPTLNATLYRGEHLLQTFGLRLIAGRPFSPDEYSYFEYGPTPTSRSPHEVIVTQALALKLWPGQSPLGNTLYLPEYGGTALRVVGVVAGLMRPSLSNGDDTAQWSLILPQQDDAGAGSSYMLRTNPADRQRVIHAATSALKKLDPKRVITQQRTLDDARAEFFQGDRAMAGLLFGAVIALLLVTGLGIVGLASFWVQQRTRMIGIRRALGATRGDILQYFQTENFLIVTLGIVPGLVFALAINLTLMKFYELPRLPLLYLPIGAVVLWALGQLAVLHPALRAAAVPPVVATRTV